MPVVPRSGQRSSNYDKSDWIAGRRAAHRVLCVTRDTRGRAAKPPFFLRTAWHEFAYLVTKRVVAGIGSCI
jgi:hypothetical protein